jgi:hypothetical protein
VCEDRFEQPGRTTPANIASVPVGEQTGGRGRAEELIAHIEGLRERAKRFSRETDVSARAPLLVSTCSKVNGGAVKPNASRIRGRTGETGTAYRR